MHFTVRDPMHRTPRSARPDHGMATAEYAVGTLGAACVAGVLVQLGTSDWFGDQLMEVLRRALDPVALLELVRGSMPFTGLRAR